jgi:hypothetical protein
METVMTKPIITLKSIKVHTTLSEETPCYTAKIYVDGKFFSDVANHGHGGPDDLRLPEGTTWDDVKALGKRIAETYPSTKYKDIVIEETLECICQTLVWRHVDVRNFASKLSRKVMFLDGGNVFELKTKKTPQLLEAAAAKYGRENVLNFMKAEDAFDLVEKAQG